MTVLLHPTYFPSIATFAVIAQNEIIWEVCDNFQKQTYRNRCYICTDQGKHMLNIPIKHVGGSEGRQRYNDVIMDSSTDWKKLHWRTLETAYRTSPYFEFYEDDLSPLFIDSDDKLLDFNLKTINTITACLGIKMTDMINEEYEVNPKNYRDARHLAEAKRPLEISQQKYNQVFEEKHGFVENLSILDLLFNEGPNAMQYLKKQSLDFM
nr:WbqC family protein [Allomuricauda sp.]